MATMVCNDCGCEFAVGVRMCPQCTSESAHEKGSEMAPKITRHGGASDLAQAPAEQIGQYDPDSDAPAGLDPASDVEPDQAKTARAVAEDQEGGDDGWDGSKLSTSSEKEPTTEPSSSLSDQSPAPTTENLSSPDLTGSSSAGTTDGATADPYDGWSKDDLQAELVDRELPKSGNVADLIARLRENDAARADEDEAGASE